MFVYRISAYMPRAAPIRLAVRAYLVIALTLVVGACKPTVPPRVRDAQVALRADGANATRARRDDAARDTLYARGIKGSTRLVYGVFEDSPESVGGRRSDGQANRLTIRTFGTGDFHSTGAVTFTIDARRSSEPTTAPVSPTRSGQR